MTSRNIHLAFLLVFVTILSAGCGAGGASLSGRGGMIEELNPFDYGDELGTAAQKKVQAVSPAKAVEAAPETPATPSSSPAPGPGAPKQTQHDSTANGTTGGERPSGEVVYRVQIGVFEDQASAKKLAADAQTKVDAKVYIEFEPPFYRVRVGDYPTRKEAETQVKLLREQGFRGSFWVLKRPNAQ